MSGQLSSSRFVQTLRESKNKRSLEYVIATLVASEQSVRSCCFVDVTLAVLQNSHIADDVKDDLLLTYYKAAYGTAVPLSYVSADHGTIGPIALLLQHERLTLAEKVFTQCARNVAVSDGTALLKALFLSDRLSLLPHQLPVFYTISSLYAQLGREQAINFYFEMMFSFLKEEVQKSEPLSPGFLGVAKVWFAQALHFLYENSFFPKAKRIVDRLQKSDVLPDSFPKLVLSIVSLSSNLEDQKALLEVLHKCTNSDDCLKVLFLLRKHEIDKALKQDFHNMIRDKYLINFLVLYEIFTDASFEEAELAAYLKSFIKGVPEKLNVTLLISGVEGRFIAKRDEKGASAELARYYRILFSACEDREAISTDALALSLYNAKLFNVMLGMLDHGVLDGGKIKMLVEEASITPCLNSHRERLGYAKLLKRMNQDYAFEVKSIDDLSLIPTDKDFGALSRLFVALAVGLIDDPAFHLFPVVGDASQAFFAFEKARAILVHIKTLGSFDAFVNQRFIAGQALPENPLSYMLESMGMRFAVGESAIDCLLREQSRLMGRLFGCAGLKKPAGDAVRHIQIFLATSLSDAEGIKRAAISLAIIHDALLIRAELTTSAVARAVPTDVPNAGAGQGFAVTPSAPAMPAAAHACYPPAVGPVAGAGIEMSNLK